MYVVQILADIFILLHRLSMRQSLQEVIFHCFTDTTKRNTIKYIKVKLLNFNLYFVFRLLLGKVFVHCMVGISRSATCVLAYLMIKKGMTAEDAIRTVRKNRYVRPNDGFLQQLAQLDNELRANY